MTQPASAPIAPIPHRVIAVLIDGVIAAALAVLLGGGLVVIATLAGGVEATLNTLAIGGPVVAALLLGWFVIYTVMQAGAGSVGMRAQGLRLVSARHDAPLGFGPALLRNLVFWIAGSIVVGYFSPLFDSSGRFQGWHDKVVDSLMLSSRAAAASAPRVAAASADSAPAAPPVPPTPPASGLSSTSPPPAAPAVPASAAFVSPTRRAVAPASPAAVSADQGSLIAFVPGVTQDPPTPREPLPPAMAPSDGAADLDATVQGGPAGRPVVPEPPSPPAAGRDDDLEHTRISVPGHRLVFTWDDGTRVSVSRRTIFGRNPAAEDGAVVVAVRDETLSLSKTHFEAAAESSGGWVLDRHSTNGMTLVRDGQRIACPAGQRVPVRLGDAIEIGDRIVTVGGYA